MNNKTSEFRFCLHSHLLRGYERSKFIIGGSVCISEYDLLIRKGYQPRFTPEVYGIVTIASKKPPTYTKSVNRTRLCEVSFVKKSWSKSYNNGIVCKRVGFNCVCINTSRQNTHLFYSFLPEQLKVEGKWDVAFLETPHPSRNPNVTEAEFIFFSKNKTFQSRLILAIWNPVSALPLWILLKPLLLSFRRDTITTKAVSQLKCLKKRKRLTFTLQREKLAFNL